MERRWGGGGHTVCSRVASTEPVPAIAPVCFCSRHFKVDFIHIDMTAAELVWLVSMIAGVDAATRPAIAVLGTVDLLLVSSNPDAPSAPTTDRTPLALPKHNESHPAGRRRQVETTPVVIEGQLWRFESVRPEYWNNTGSDGPSGPSYRTDLGPGRSTHHVPPLDFKSL